jgi:hypothetical protein
MIYVPNKFQPKHPFPYPSDNHHEFERWYYDNYDMQPEEREYLPIFWTGYYCRHKFGQHKPAMVDLQKFLDGLDRSKRYYTIVQYDNGILSNLRDLDIMVFSMSGGRTDYPLPLISEPHKYCPSHWERPYLGNFVGRVTHDIRRCVTSSPVVGYGEQHGYYVATIDHSLDRFCSILSRSVFTLCPRGFGPTSFRIQEALQYGSIPVYISDEFIIPHNLPFEHYGVLIEAKDTYRVHEILSAIPESEIRRRQEAIPHIYQKYFTYEGNQEAIQKAVAQCSNTVSGIPV